jgi:uncharacterized protein (DUF1800 family)
MFVRQIAGSRLVGRVLALLGLGVALALAGAKKIKPIKAKDNPPQYIAFSKLLPEDDRLHHALDRLTFGPRPGDLDEVEQTGLAKWLDEQLHPERIPENQILAPRLAALEAANLTARELSAAKVLRAVYSNRQLQQLMIDFWYNHFNVFLNKGRDKDFVPAYERETIEPHVFGSFYELLLATAESPAMLFYLDNWQSVAPDLPARPGQKRKRGLNENYARELLELHTLGVDGGYTQQDVIEVARCFTGWTIANPRAGGGFEYRDRVHDKGQKVVLGHVIAAGGGMNDGLEVLQILAHHPSTAHFISLQLARRFVADDPPPSLVTRMSRTFLKTNGDLRQVVQAMVWSPEFFSQGAFRAKVKMPLEMVASALRATNADVETAFALGNELQKLGEPLYRKIEPTGYSSANAEWISSAGLLDRMNFAVALAHNRIPGVTVASADWQTIGSPDFQRK